jgi:hypothetical protein
MCGQRLKPDLLDPSSSPGPSRARPAENGLELGQLRGGADDFPTCNRQ